MNHPESFFARKLFHFFFLLVPLLYFHGICPRFSFCGGMDDRYFFSGLFVFAFLLHLGWELGRKKFHFLNQLYHHTAGYFLKSGEEEKLPGSLWLLLSIAVTIAIFPPEIAVLSLIPALAGDPAAAISGKVFPIYRFPWGKSVGGFLGGVVVSLVLATLVDSPSRIFPPGWKAGIYTLVFLVEILPLKLDDNLYLALLAGGFFSLADLFLD